MSETNVAQELANKVCFAMVSLHRWRGQYKIKDAIVKVANAELKQELITTPRWSLMPELWHKKFSGIESSVASAISAAKIRNPEDESEQSESIKEAAKFPLRGVHIIPRAKMVDFFDNLKEIEEKEFKPLVEDFGKNWPQIYADIQAKVAAQPAVWTIMSRHLPVSAIDVMNKCWIEKALVPISFSQDATYLTNSDAEDYVAKVKEYGQRFTQQLASTILEGLDGELREAVDTLINRVNEGGNLRGSNLQAVRSAFEKYQSFDFLMTPELQTKMLGIQQNLDLDVKDLNSALKHDGQTSITAQLALALKDIKVHTDQELSRAKAQAIKGGRNIRY